VPNNRDVDLTYATSSSKAADASSKHERANMGQGKVTTLSECNVADSKDRAQLHTHVELPENTNLTMISLLFPAQGRSGLFYNAIML